MADLIGTTIEQYQIVEQIGQGGMATVYKAYQPSINRYVAIKILPSQFAKDANFVKRFEHEAKAIAALEHPHILPVFDFGAQGDLYYMVMRYVSGGTLTDLMTKSISYERAVDIIAPIARALDYAHNQGVVHRDVKPSNILIDKNGEPLLTDFGIAKLMEGSEGSTQLTAAGSILGTPAYMAPEQAMGAHLDRRTDIYSLGVVLYELLVGRPPFQSDKTLAVMLMHVNEPLPMPRKINPSVPEALEQVVVKAMAKDPAQRYQTAADMEHALRDALRRIEAAGMTIATSGMGGRATGTNVGAASATGTRAELTQPPAKTGRSLGPLFIIGGIFALIACVLIGGMATWAMFRSGGDGTPPAKVIGEDKVTLGTPEPSPTVGGADETPTPVKPVLPPGTEEFGPTPTPESGKTTVSDTPLAPGTLLLDEFNDDRYCWADSGNHLFGNYRSEIRNGMLRLNMQAKQGATFYGSIPGVDYADFVASVEATPSGEGSPALGYGLIFRANPKGDHYLFEIRENSQFAVYLISHDKDEWQDLIKPTIWSKIDPAGMNQLSVQAVGSSFTFFINGEQVGQIEDATIPTGSVGVLIEMNEGDDTTVDFDNLSIRLPDGAPAESGNQILLIDCFNANDNGWSVGSFSDTGFESDTSIDGKYTVDITAKQEDGYVYRDEITGKKFDDFVLSVQATPEDSETYYTYGLVFRKAGQTFYTFEIGNDGRYNVYLFDNEWKTIFNGTSKAVNAGDTNELRIIAHGDRLLFFVNGEQVASAIDSTSLSGQVGLINSVLENGKSSTVKFDNLVVTGLNSYTLAHAGNPYTNSGDGLVLFSDSFDSDEHGWTTGDAETDYSQNTVTIADGKYSLAATAKKPAYMQKDLPGYEFDNFILSLDVTPRDSETYYAFGVAFRENEDGHTYVFEIANDGQYTVQLFQEEWQALQDWVESTAIKPGQTNELMIKASGTSMSFFINGELVTTLEDSTLADGRVGLMMEIFDQGKSATVDYDNLMIQAETSQP